MWSGILATCKNSVLIASLTFGINSGAYVAEIVRAGILAVDKGQMEAGRSLGLNKFHTFVDWHTTLFAHGVVYVIIFVISHSENP